MGYRLNVRKVRPEEICGGKLFGYTDARELKAFRFLVEKGLLEEEDWIHFEGYGEMPLVLDAETFRRFVELYDEDLREHGTVGPAFTLAGDPEVQKLLEDPCDKVIHWGA